MKHQQFMQAFKRAEVGHGPWFSNDLASDVVHDIRAFCPEEWAEMLDAVNGSLPAAARRSEVENEIRHILSLRKAC